MCGQPFSSPRARQKTPSLESHPDTQWYRRHAGVLPRGFRERRIKTAACTSKCKDHLRVLKKKMMLRYLQDAFSFILKLHKMKLRIENGKIRQFWKRKKKKTLLCIKSYIKSFLSGRNWHFERYEKGIFCRTAVETLFCIYRLHESRDTARCVWMH